MGITREFKRYFRLVWGWAWLIILGALIAGGINYYLSSKAPPRYEANITLMVGQFIRQANPDQVEAGVADRLAFYYTELIRRQPVLEEVKKELQLNLPNDALAEMVSAQIVPATSLIEIRVVHEDPIKAVELVRSFANHLIKQSPTAPENQRKEQLEFVQQQLLDLQGRIEKGRAELDKLTKDLDGAATAAEIADINGKIKALEAQIDGWQTNYTNLLRTSSNSSPNSLNILEDAKQARRVKTVSPLISAGIAAAIGAFLALCCAILLEYLDDRVKSIEDLRSRLHLNLLGHIKRQKKKKKQPSPDLGFLPNIEVAQAYEIITTNILFSQNFDNKRRSILLTSPDEMIERGEVSLNLATSMVSFEQEVLLVDADTRKPELHKLLDMDNQEGFFEVFYGNGYINLEDKVRETGVPNLYLMSGGFDSPDSQKITAVRTGTQQIYNLPHQALPGNFVVFSCSSILSDKTARLLTANVSGIVLVCALKKTRGQELKAAIEVIERLRGNILGVITLDRPARSTLKFLRKPPKKPVASISHDAPDSDTVVPEDIPAKV
jgi:polysaccharide biosynthesis transport protein